MSSSDKTGYPVQAPVIGDVHHDKNASANNDGVVTVTLFGRYKAIENNQLVTPRFYVKGRLDGCPRERYLSSC